MQIYTYNIREMTETEYEKWYLMTDENRRKRIDSLRFTDDRKRTVAGEMLARKAISQSDNLAPEEVIFEKTQYGKPYALNSDIHFSISHAADFAVCAADNTPVGIDIENLRPVNLRIAKKIFSDDEIKYIFGHSPMENEFTETDDKETINRFFTLWTKNEAVGKCVGTGLLHEENYDDYDIETFIFRQDYIVSVCRRKSV